MTSVEHWTIAKSADQSKNEDRFGFDSRTLVLADGATDKAGVDYPSGRTGGLELAFIGVSTALSSDSTGYELADEVTDAVRAFYAEHNPDALEDASKRAATTLVVARFLTNKLVVTQVGDTNVRLTMRSGERTVLTNDKRIDEENAQLRADSIQAELARFNAEHGAAPEGEALQAIIAGGREAILSRLKRQYLLQNSDHDERYGYGTIDGTNIPRTFVSGKPTSYVKQFEFDADAVSTIELVSDGFYGQFPNEAQIDAYKMLYEHLHAADPHKYILYPSTKPIDDATVMIRHS